MELGEGKQERQGGAAGGRWVRQDSIQEIYRLYIHTEHVRQEEGGR